MTITDLSVGMIPHGVIQGDCIAGMKHMEGGSVQLVVLDPPYNVNYEYDTYDDKRSAEDYLAWSAAWLSEVYRLLSPTGSFWLVIGPHYVSELDVLAKRIGFKWRKHLIWYYTFGQNSTNNFTSSHTHLLYYTKSDDFTFNADECRVPSARQLVYSDKRANPDGRLPDDTWILRPQIIDAFGSGEDVWHVPRVAGTFRARRDTPNQLPEQLVGRIIRLCSNPDDLVFDAFVGSGCTPAVAKKLGRRWCGFELSENYAQLAAERVAAARVGDALDGPDIQGG
ncbi:MAG TPA: site-specific DNA-methyltransferase [Gemmatimonadales bacterium]|nr:site-specific DNA-methyltransferase [Gemmatimonadales bacterium]